MAAPTLAELKTYLGISGSSEDTALTQVKDSVQNLIERHTGRVFAVNPTLREFDAERPYVSRDKRTLLFYAEASGVVSLGNGCGAAALTTDDYDWLSLEADRGEPYYGIRLRKHSSQRWMSCKSQRIGVNAAWNEFTGTNADSAFHLMLDMCQYFYKARSSGRGGALTVASRQTGIVVEPGDLEPQLLRRLDMLVRHGIS